ncbi:hypothetical protein NDU88_000936 [Pleurodeles waltl]|uniref:Uncharacterized protein n=1 Tax=Pleurodeles waltl TaxID=8319 RepID=A0AAV7TH55_PLEWA|nr:hypothetical protein NDU88_000936 [Pleurodeles waltl]
MTVRSDDVLGNYAAAWGVSVQCSWCSTFKIKRNKPSRRLCVSSVSLHQAHFKDPFHNGRGGCIFRAKEV